jgi:diguanylate cyclase (GGDEF)-like protein
MKAVECPACGEATSVPSCPSCGADLLADAVGDGEHEAAVVDRDQTLSDEDQSLSDEDQTASDQDQTWSDHDQTASDRDQLSSDEDQEVADEELAAGGDAAAHRRGTLARQHTSQDRTDVSVLRDETAAARLGSAGRRDRDALIRDRNAEARDAAARVQDEQDDEHASREAILARAARDRARAASDRAKAAADRIEAAADRDVAAREREEAHSARVDLATSLTLASKDQLTGAWSREFGLAELARELRRSQRAGTTLVLAFVGVDGLKQINDSEGRAAGNELLRLIGATVHAALRPYDIVVRQADDELLCAMPSIGSDEAKTRFHKVATALKTATSHSITTGFAESAAGDSLDDLIAAAEADLLAQRRLHPND